ncbi:MAG: hypothetical protein FWE04_00540 [Oscillospiraceae bacterium]|nr:hypothetical protein [Oscillospiraceae bacterium]
MNSAQKIGELCFELVTALRDMIEEQRVEEMASYYEMEQNKSTENSVE